MKKKQNVVIFLVTFLLCMSLHAQTDPGMENLTHWWSFDDGTANDMVGEANGVVMGEADISGGALHVATLEQWVELPGDVISIADYEEITVSTSFTAVPDSNDGYHMIIYFGDIIGDLGCYGFFISPARGDDVSRGAISCGVDTNPWTAENGVNGPEVEDDDLHNMVVTINDTDIEFYVDGEWMGNAALDPDNGLWNISYNYAFIGRGGYVADPCYRSSIHDVRIYNRVLTEDEVYYLHENAHATSVQNRPDKQPQNFTLEQNFPNPFNPTTGISFSIAQPNHTTLEIYDILGKRVTTLVNQNLLAGSYNVSWDATNFNGDIVNSGTYFYTLKSGDHIETHKMLLLK